MLTFSQEPYRLQSETELFKLRTQIRAEINQLRTKMDSFHLEAKTPEKKHFSR